MIVISDTTPLISLLKVNRLNLLQQLFGYVHIPEAVFQELLANPRYGEEGQIIQASPFIQTHSLGDEKLIRLMCSTVKLDRGEVEAILLAEQLNADYLLMDEFRGRKVAKSMDLPILGTLGILIKAYDEKLLSANEVKESMDLMMEHGIRFSKALYEEILEAVF